VKSATESLNFRQSLLEFLEAGPGHEEALLEEFERKRGQGDPLYSSLLYLLTHLNFTERQATRHWKKVVAHRDVLRAAIGRDPGLRVAILDYFVNVSRELKNPKVIELAIYERTERSAVTDGLTGLYNHAFFLQALRQEVLRSKRHGLRAALLLLDLDNFKRVNDERGHVEGDRVLMKAAAVVREGVREIDVAARYGGEEFAVLLPDTSRLGASDVAERNRRRI
jgi:GGDEF domain-containing protein